MSNKKKKSTGKKQVAPAPAGNAALIKRKILIGVRWSAWITLLSVIVTQMAEQPLEDKVALSMFVIAGLLYAISMVLEKKYKW